MAGFDLIITPDQQDAEAAEVCVDGTIGDRRYRFLLDTGAARTSVAFDAYTASFDSHETSSYSGVFAASSDALISVPRIELGPISKTNFTVARTRQDHPIERHLIGMDLLKDYCCHFLFDAHRVMIDANDDQNGEYQLLDLFLDRTFHPYVDVQLGAVSAQAVWDTGAGITIADMNFIRAYPAFFHEVGRSHGTDATGHTTETPMFMMAATVIGGRTFPPHNVAGVDLSGVNATIDVPMQLILGYSTLRQANWLFDFPRKKWAVLSMLNGS